MNKYASLYIEEFQKNSNLGNLISKGILNLTSKTPLKNVGRGLVDGGKGYIDALKEMFINAFGKNNKQISERIAYLNPMMAKTLREARKDWMKSVPKGKYDPVNSALIGAELAAYTPAALAGTGALGTGAYGLNAIMNQKPPSPPPSLLEKIFGGK